MLFNFGSGTISPTHVLRWAVNFSKLHVHMFDKSFSCHLEHSYHTFYNPHWLDNIAIYQQKWVITSLESSPLRAWEFISTRSISVPSKCLQLRHAVSSTFCQKRYTWRATKFTAHITVHTACRFAEHHDQNIRLELIMHRPDCRHHTICI